MGIRLDNQVPVSKPIQNPKIVVELMLARSPKVPMLQKMAAKYGATDAR